MKYELVEFYNMTEAKARVESMAKDGWSVHTMTVVPPAPGTYQTYQSVVVLFERPDSTSITYDLRNKDGSQMTGEQAEAAGAAVANYMASHHHDVVHTMGNERYGTLDK